MSEAWVLLGTAALALPCRCRKPEIRHDRGVRFEPAGIRRDKQDNDQKQLRGFCMMVFEIIAAFVITLSLGSMMNADTRDNRVRVTRERV